jgi:hypothetical protein
MRFFNVAAVAKVATSGDVKEPEVLSTPVMRAFTSDAVKAGDAASVALGQIARVGRLFDQR